MSHPNACARNSSGVDSRTLQTSRQPRGRRCLRAREGALKLESTRSFAARYHRSGRPFFLGAGSVDLDDDVEPTRLGLGRERLSLTLIAEPSEIRLEAPAGIVAQLHSREAGRRCLGHDCLGGGPVASVAENGLVPAERLPLDALQRHAEPLASGLVLEIDPDVERVDSPDDDAEAVAAL